MISGEAKWERILGKRRLPFSCGHVPTPDITLHVRLGTPAQLLRPAANLDNSSFNSMMFDAATINEAAIRYGFKRKRKANWVRHTVDFVQLVNLQGSAWSKDQNYLNFALWPLALGEPKAFAESKFMFRTRAADLDGLFDLAGRLQSVDDLRTSLAARTVSGLLSTELHNLLKA